MKEKNKPYLIIRYSILAEVRYGRFPETVYYKNACTNSEQIEQIEIHK